MPLNNNYSNISNLETEDIYQEVIKKIENDKTIASRVNSSRYNETKFNNLLFNFLKKHIVKYDNNRRNDECYDSN